MIINFDSGTIEINISISKFPFLDSSTTTTKTMVYNDQSNHHTPDYNTNMSGHTGVPGV